ncbi:hypothetical protein F8M41_010888 [Gigaspora margarita]|uniref:Uncharacterized protein n=1 Tax=Gigaspora margarita TaxID=4874 RepID=A0A8H4EQ40_GIGMA|nr:hypothetical protein F8M41_010888 [Gigaspora margarita]
MEWRRVPHEQRKILDALPGWESDKTGISEPENINKRKLSAITSEESKEITMNTKSAEMPPEKARKKLNPFSSHPGWGVHIEILVCGLIFKYRITC